MKHKPLKKYPHKAWWQTVAANFLGALLGIIVTFGVSAYLTQATKKEKYRKLVINTLGNIDANIKSMEIDCAQILEKDSLFEAIIAQYPHFERISADSLGLFIHHISSIQLSFNDYTAENMFNNTDVLYQMDDLALIDYIGNCYAGFHLFQGVHTRLYAHLQQMYRQFSAKKKFNEYPDALAAVKGLFEIPEAYNYLTSREFHHYRIFLTEVKDRVKDLHGMAKRLSNITDEEIRHAYQVKMNP